MGRKILIMGLPGGGKTRLARALAARLNAVHFNADAVRQEINRDLGFSEIDRLEHARRMGWLCDQVTKTGCLVVADFICPTPATRTAFERGGKAFIVWVDRITESRFDADATGRTPGARLLFAFISVFALTNSLAWPASPLPIRRQRELTDKPRGSEQPTTHSTPPAPSGMRHVAVDSAKRSPAKFVRRTIRYTADRSGDQGSHAEPSEACRAPIAAG
jgi:hypothetical protein